jgi:hypothetical protein
MIQPNIRIFTLLLFNMMKAGSKRTAPSPGDHEDTPKRARATDEEITGKTTEKVVEWLRKHRDEPNKTDAAIRDGGLPVLEELDALLGKGLPQPTVEGWAATPNNAVRQWLMDHGLTKNAKDAVPAFAARGNLDGIRFLVEGHKLFTVMTITQALCRAAENGHLEVVRWIVGKELALEALGEARKAARLNGHWGVESWIEDNDLDANASTLRVVEYDDDGEVELDQTWIFDASNPDHVAAIPPQKFQNGMLDNIPSDLLQRYYFPRGPWQPRSRQENIVAALRRMEGHSRYPEVKFGEP